MFNIPEACVFADLVEHFEAAKLAKPTEAPPASSSKFVKTDDIGGASFDLAGTSTASIPTSTDHAVNPAFLALI